MSGVSAELQQLLGANLRLPTSVAPIIRHVAVDPNFVDTLIECHDATLHTMCVSAEGESPASAVKNPTSTTSSGGIVAQHQDDKKLLSYSPCDSFIRVSSEGEWHQSMRAEELEYNARMNQFASAGALANSAKNNPAGKVNDNLLQWRLMNWAFSLRKPNPAQASTIPYRAPGGNVSVTIPGTPASKVGPSLVVPSPTANADSSRFSQLLSPHSSNLVNALLTLDPSSASATSAPRSKVKNAHASLMLASPQGAGLFQPLSPSSAQAGAALLGISGQQPVAATTKINKKLPLHPVSTLGNPESGVKRVAATVGLADANGKKAKLDPATSAAPSLSPPKPLRYPANHTVAVTAPM